MGKPKRSFLVAIIAMGVVVVLGLIEYTPQIDLSSWHELLLLALLATYLQMKQISLDDQVRFSSILAIILPLLFIYGVGEAMWLSILTSTLYGLVHKTGWRKWVANALQFALTGLIAGTVFNQLHPTLGVFIFPQSIGPMFITLLVYAIINLCLVILLTTLLRPNSFKIFLSNNTLKLMVASTFSGYEGIVYALLISSWGTYGTIVFGLLLLFANSLMRFSFQLKNEQILRLKYEQQLIIDTKTEVYNYRFLRDWLDEEELNQCKHFSLLFVDIDDFKHVNDSYGHPQGDKILKEVAQEIVATVRADDRVVRYGGDEFLVLLPNIDGEQAISIAQRIQDRLVEISRDEKFVPITVSIGIASYPKDATDKHSLIRSADMAMYRAKEQGKNCFRTCASV